MPQYRMTPSPFDQSGRFHYVYRHVQDERGLWHFERVIENEPEPQDAEIGPSIAASIVNEALADQIIANTEALVDTTLEGDSPVSVCFNIYRPDWSPSMEDNFHCYVTRVEIHDDGHSVTTGVALVTMQQLSRNGVLSTHFSNAEWHSSLVSELESGQFDGYRYYAVITEDSPEAMSFDVARPRPNATQRARATSYWQGPMYLMALHDTNDLFNGMGALTNEGLFRRADLSSFIPSLVAPNAVCETRTDHRMPHYADTWYEMYFDRATHVDAANLGTSMAAIHANASTLGVLTGQTLIGWYRWYGNNYSTSQWRLVVSQLSGLSRIRTFEWTPPLYCDTMDHPNALINELWYSEREEDDEYDDERDEYGDGHHPATNGLLALPAFGVELEVIGSKYDLSAALSVEGVDHDDSMTYTHGRRPYWKMVPDGSLPDNGVELVSPVMPYSEESETNIKAVTRAMRNSGCRATSACGLHIHHNAMYWTPEALAKLVEGYVAAQPIIDRVTRYDNSYCMPINRDIAVAIRDWARSVAGRSNVPVTRAGGLVYDRYQTLNLTSLSRHGTVEFRQHPGTTTAKHVLNWYRLTRAMVERANDVNVSFPELPTRLNRDSVTRSMVETYVKELGCLPRTVDFYGERFDARTR